MARSGRVRTERATVFALAFLILAIGFGDGLAFGLATTLQVGSPWYFLLPPILLGFGAYWVLSRRVMRPSAFVEILVLANILLITLVVQVFTFRAVNIGGFLQLIGFLVIVLITRATFAEAPRRIVAAVPRAIVIAHYVLCSYVLLAFVTWHLTGFDLSLIRLLSGQQPVSDFYGFRPSGLSREPSWTALALAASYTGVFCLAPRHRFRALIALIAAAATLQAASMLPFLAAIGVAYLVYSRGPLSKLAVAAGPLVVLLILVSSSPRIGEVLTGQDASSRARAGSGEVGLQIVSKSFPWGVGYGNFRSAAVLAPDIGIYAYVAQSADSYKSDFFPLNYVAELGIVGLVACLWLALTFARARHLLPLAFYLMLVGLSGTVLMPSVLVVAMIVGTMEANRAMRAPPQTPSGGGGRWRGAAPLRS
jgi:hypothetical protein